MLKNRSIGLIAGIAVVIAAPAGAEEWTPLLDTSMSQFEVWMGVPHSSVKGLPEGTYQSDNCHKGTPMGLNNDVKKVFTVSEIDGEPVLHITGEVFGGLTTLKSYENYHLSVMFKWGEKQWEPRPKTLRDSGILYHCTGPHGAFWSVWKSCIEYQVQETDLGDLFLLGGTGADVRTMDSGKNGKYDPKGTRYSLGNARASAEPDAPHGEWNQLEIYTIGRTSVHVVNGEVVMVVENARAKGGAPLTGGQIQFQSEAAECYYKDIKISPITDFPADIKARIPTAPIAKP